MRARFQAGAVCLALTTLLLVGCAGYRLGPTGGVAAGETTLMVRPLINETREPRLVDPIQSAVRREIQRDGTFKLATRGDAEISLEGTITRFVRDQVSFTPSDVVTVRDYQLFVYCRFVATDTITGEVLLDREVRGRTTIRVGSDLASQERQAIPLAAEDMARSVVGLLADGDWRAE